MFNRSVILVLLGAIVFVYGLLFFQQSKGDYSLMFVGLAIMGFSGLSAIQIRYQKSRRDAQNRRAEHDETDAVTSRIAAAYAQDRDSAELQNFMSVVRESRKFGFPMLCTLDDASTELQMHCAACMLLRVAETWPFEDLPEQLDLQPDTALFRDAEYLLMNALGCTQQFVETYFPDDDTPGHEYEQSAQ